MPVPEMIGVVTLSGLIVPVTENALLMIIFRLKVTVLPELIYNCRAVNVAPVPVIDCVVPPKVSLVLLELFALYVPLSTKFPLIVRGRLVRVAV